MALSENKLKELDEKLLKLTVDNFERFCIITGVDKIRAYICLEKQKGKSFGEIAQILGISKQAVAQRCKKCS